MLEIVRVPVTARVGTGYVNSDMKRGTFVVASGTFTASDISALPTTQRNKQGYASAGDLKLVKAYDGTFSSRGPAYPVDKRTTVPEGGDSDYETIKAGSQVVYYTEGEFRTSEYTNLTTTVTFGDYLKLSASGTLTDETNLKTATANTVARVIGLFDDSSDLSERRLQFELVNVGV